MKDAMEKKKKEREKVGGDFPKVLSLPKHWTGRCNFVHIFM